MEFSGTGTYRPAHDDRFFPVVSFHLVPRVSYARGSRVHQGRTHAHVHATRRSRHPRHGHVARHRPVLVVVSGVRRGHHAGSVVRRRPCCRRHGRRRLRPRPGHRVSGRPGARVRQLAGEAGQAERGRRLRHRRQETTGGGAGRPAGHGPRPSQVTAGQRPADRRVPGTGHRRVLRNAHPAHIATVDLGRRHRPGTGPRRYCAQQSSSCHNRVSLIIIYCYYDKFTVRNRFS